MKGSLLGLRTAKSIGERNEKPDKQRGLSFPEPNQPSFCFLFDIPKKKGRGVGFCFWYWVYFLRFRSSIAATAAITTTATTATAYNASAGIASGAACVLGDGD
jgi:hypothetical protein